MSDNLKDRMDLKKREQERREKNFTKILQLLFSKTPIKENAIIVEGKIDKKFSESLFNSNNCECIRLNGIDNVKFIFSCNNSKRKKSKELEKALNDEENKNKINKLIEMRNKNQVVGFVDKDFRDAQPDQQFLKEDYYPLFETETTDLEILLCKHGGLRFFLSKSCEESKVKNLEKILKNQASISGFARFLNGRESDENGKKISISYNSFKKLNEATRFRDFLKKDRSVRCDDIKTCLEDDEKNSDQTKKAFFDRYEKECSRKRIKYDKDLWLICQGHDTMNILLILLEIHCQYEKSLNYTDHQSSEKLSKKILGQFIEHQCYKKSSMIKQIIEWEKKNRLSNPSMAGCGRLFKDCVYDAFNDPPCNDRPLELCT
jgi:hypothetical protein